MGHYLSESYSDEYWAEQEAKAKAHRERLTAYITTDIEQRGLVQVLADIVEDPTMYRVRAR